MVRIGLISDTHGFLDPRIADYFADRDQIWHAGDIGRLSVAEELAKLAPVQGVFGNIDGPEIRDRYPEHLRFRCEQMEIGITHIGGYPGKWDRRVRHSIRTEPPDVFICGHSHIVRVMKEGALIHLNPGAAGLEGFHSLRTVMRFEICESSIHNLELIELGPRSAVL